MFCADKISTSFTFSLSWCWYLSALLSSRRGSSPSLRRLRRRRRRRSLQGDFFINDNFILTMIIGQYINSWTKGTSASKVNVMSLHHCHLPLDHDHYNHYRRTNLFSHNHHDIWPGLHQASHQISWESSPKQRRWWEVVSTFLFITHDPITLAHRCTIFLCHLDLEI